MILALNIFGPGVKRVWSMGEHPRDVMRLDWGGNADRPAEGVIITSNVGAVHHCAFFVEAYGSQGAVQSRPFNDFRFPSGAANILRIVKQMLQILAGAHACGLRLFPEDNRTMATLLPIRMSKMDDVYCDLLSRQIATAINQADAVRYI